ncbi:MAG TPA: hypothetical protein VGM56_30375, partial [Byssovorax sp.]
MRLLAVLALSAVALAACAPAAGVRTPALPASDSSRVAAPARAPEQAPPSAPSASTGFHAPSDAEAQADAALPHGAHGGERGSVTASVLSLDPLPIVDIAPEPPAIDTSFFAPLVPRTKLVGLARSPEVLTKGSRVTVLGHRWGKIDVASEEQPFFVFGDGGTWLMRTRGVTTFTWSSLDPLPDGAIAFEEATGFYDVEEHRAYERWRMPRARAVPILGGLAYAFRTRCAACEPGRREALHVLGAAAFSEAVGGGASDAHFDDTFTHAHVPLDAGTSGGARMFVLERVAA